MQRHLADALVEVVLQFIKTLALVGGDGDELDAFRAKAADALQAPFFSGFDGGGPPSWKMSSTWVTMRRMSISPVFGYTYLVIYSLSAVPGMLLMCLALTAGAMRPDRDPELLQWLYDFAFLSFSGTMGVFLIGSLLWMAAILIDHNWVFPKWFGYLNLCNALTEVVVAPAWIFHRGVFAWNGLICWWINIVVFGLYTGAFIVLLRQMIRREDFGTAALPDLVRAA